MEQISICTGEYLAKKDLGIICSADRRDCVYGHNVSADAVATLRAAGWDAHALAGGIEGGEDGADAEKDIAQWRAQPAPAIIKRPDWGVTGERASR